MNPTKPFSWTGYWSFLLDWETSKYTLWRASLFKPFGIAESYLGLPRIIDISRSWKVGPWCWAEKQIDPKIFCTYRIPPLDHSDNDSNPSKNLAPVVRSLALAKYGIWPTKSLPFRAFPSHCPSYIYVRCSGHCVGFSNRVYFFRKGRWRAIEGWHCSRSH